MKLKFILGLFFLILSNYASAETHANFWPTIPFVRGADLCQYKDAYGQTRSEYMAKMVRLASELMYNGSSGREAWALLQNFNQMYDQNLALATQNDYLDVSLESTFKSFIGGYYRNLRPRTQNISFTYANELLNLVRAKQPPTYLDPILLSKLDFIAYGTYSFAPDCRGDLLVTLHLIGRNGEERSYQGQAEPSVVMSRIAAQIFEDFQRTQFPSIIKVGAKNLTLVGGLNSSVDSAVSPLVAKQSCETLNARLPNDFELEILNGYGDWSGGVSLGEAVWALPTGKVFAPMLRNPSPIREVWEVNAQEFKYYCVRD